MTKKATALTMFGLLLVGAITIFAQNFSLDIKELRVRINDHQADR